MNETIYTPPPTVARMLQSQSDKIYIQGPVGSGKSTGCIMKIAKLAMEQARGNDGIRRTKWAVVRNTWPMLRDTTLATFLEWFPNGVAGEWKETSKSFIMRINDMEAEFLFRPLDSPDDVRKLLSLEITGALVNEAREIPQEIIEGIASRCGRYPSEKNGGATWSGIICDTNPPDLDTYWWEIAEGKHPGWDVYKQPGGMEPNAENKENLRKRYYENLVETNSAGWCDVYVHAHYGLGNAGKPVFPDFRRDLHVAKHVLNPIPGVRDVLIGMDFGLNPSAVIGMLDSFGRLLVVDEVFAGGMGVTRFVETKLGPLLAFKYANCDVRIYGDPAGVARAQTDERSCFEILRGFGYKAKPTGDNTLVERLGAVEARLTTLVDGVGSVIISPHVQRLIAALSGGYRFKKTKGLTDEPDKNEYSHIADAFQYLCVAVTDVSHRKKMNERRPPRVPYRAGDLRMGY